MAFITPEASALVRKELWQIRRSRGAVFSAAIPAILLMLVVPLGQLVTLPMSSASPVALPQSMLLFNLGEFDDATRLFTHLLMPLFVAHSALLVPSLAVNYTIIAERERRSVELLLALPVRVNDIVVAKLLATLIMSALILLPLFVVDVFVLRAAAVAAPVYLALLLSVLIAALLCSMGLAFLLALIARDLRTATSLKGLLLGPLSLLMLATLTGLPGEGGLLVLAAALAAVGLGTTVAGLRWLTVERYVA